MRVARKSNERAYPGRRDGPAQKVTELKRGDVKRDTGAEEHVPGVWGGRVTTAPMRDTREEQHGAGIR